MIHRIELEDDDFEVLLEVLALATGMMMADEGNRIFMPPSVEAIDKLVLAVKEHE
jgi:hypothetical protein